MAASECAILLNNIIPPAKPGGMILFLWLSNWNLPAGMHRRAIRARQAGKYRYTIGPTRFDTAEVKLEFIGRYAPAGNA